MAEHDTFLTETGAMVLASADPNSHSWLPAVVERIGGNNQIVATAFMNGNTVPFDGAKHIDDPWWDRPESRAIAVEEGIWIWKLSPATVRLRELEDMAFEAIKTASSPRRPQPKRQQPQTQEIV
jgi:hypothetical protein